MVSSLDSVFCPEGSISLNDASIGDFFFNAFTEKIRAIMFSIPSTIKDKPVITGISSAKKEGFIIIIRPSAIPKSERKKTQYQILARTFLS